MRRLPPLELRFPDSPDAVPVRIVHGDVRTVGRAVECGVCLNNQSVSREHAVIRYGDDGAVVEDKRSKHGTRLNGVSLVAGIAAPFGEGDVIEFGPVHVRVDRLYERVRTEQLGAGDEPVRTVVLESRAGAPQLIRVLRELMRMDPGEGGREGAAQAVLRQVLSVTGLERGLLVRGAGDPNDDGRVSVVARIGAGSGAVSRTVLTAAKDPSKVAHLSQSQQFRYAESIIGSGVTETLCARVPVRSGEELYLYLDSSRASSMVADEAAEFVGVAAGVCGLVFDGIEYRKLSEMRSHFERAASVQKRLLPDRTGDAGSLAWALESHPAAPPDEANLGASVSGDIVGVARRPDGSTLAWIGDVCGHGMGAALLMSAAQSWLHAAAGRVEDPAVTLTALNSFLFEHTESFDFASLLVVAIGDDGSVDLCDAGHGHAFLVTGGRVECVEFPADSGGLVVGATPDARYSSMRMSLASGDRIVLATDGVREAKSASGEDFGTDRVMKALGGSTDAASDVSRLLAALSVHAGGVRADDITVLSISRGS